MFDESEYRLRFRSMDELWLELINVTIPGWDVSDERDEEAGKH